MIVLQLNTSIGLTKEQATHALLFYFNGLVLNEVPFDRILRDANGLTKTRAEDVILGVAIRRGTSYLSHGLQHLRYKEETLELVHLIEAKVQSFWGDA